MLNTLFESEGMFLKHNPHSDAYIFNFTGHVCVYPGNSLPKSMEELVKDHSDIKSKIFNKSISESSVKEMFEKLYKPLSL